ncbi:hypothetical protein GCM10010401_23210 [Rarobacter faecitabidus]
MLAAGTVFAISASLMGICAPGATAADIEGGTWSTTYETGQPQPLSRVAYEPVVNLHGETDAAQDLVTSVYSADANGGNTGAENVSLIADREKTSKWLVSRTLNAGNPVQAIYSLSQPSRVTGYEITSANDNYNRDPKNWIVYGSNSASAATSTSDASWVPIDTVTNADFVVTASPRRGTKRFEVDAPGSYQYYRIAVSDSNGATDRMQLSDWTLLTPDAPSTRARRVAPAEIVSASANPTAGWQADGENFDKLHDGDYGTKSLVAPGIDYANFYMLYELAAETQIDGYIFTAGNDAPERDPKAWTIWGTSDPAVAATPASTAGWTQIDSRSDIASTTYRRGSRYFTAASPGSFKWVQLRVSGDNGGRFQMSEWTLTSPLADNPNLAVKLADGRAEGGTASNTVLAYAGSPVAAGAASSAILIHQGLDVAIGSDTALSYRIKPTSASGKNVVVDVEYSDAGGANPGVATQASLHDIRGNVFSTAGQGAALLANQWSKVTVPLGSLAGKVVHKVVVRYAEASATAGSVASGLIDDVAIGSSPFTGSLTVKNVVNTQLRAGQANNKVLGVITGLGTVATGNDLAAVLHLNDAANTELPLVLTEGENGTSVSLDPAYRPQQAGIFNARITATLGAASASANFTLTVVADDSLTGQFEDLANLACFTVTGTVADCDGNTYAYDRVKLAALNYIPGQNGTVTIGATTFHFEVPNIPVGQFDTITPAGQAWNIRVPAGATQISFIGTGNEGTKSRDIQLVYTDGTTETVTVTFADWATSDTTNFTNAGNTVVARPQGRLMGTSSSDNLFSAVLASTPHTLAAGKTIDYVQLPPKVGNIKPEGQVHLFTFATDAPVPASVPAPVVTASTVPAQQATVPFSGELVTFTGATNPVNATINWGDGTASSNGTIGSGNVSGSHTYATPGTYTATVTVTGAGTSASTTTEIVVTTASSSVTLTGPSTNPIGTAANVTATVAPAAATGTVQWSVDGVDSGTPTPLNGSNQVTFDVSGLTAGSHSIVATYSGDSVFATSASAGHAITITKLASSITLGASASSVTIGDSVTLTATVSPAVAGRSVTFTGPDSWSATATTNASGIATTSVTPSAVGAANYSASVAENATYLTATSTPVGVTVVKKVLAAGDWTVSAPTGSVTVGGAGSVNVTLPSLATGTVSFQVGSSTPVVVPVTAGQASFATSSLVAGTHTITVAYSGDSNYDAPAPKTANVTVVKNITSVTLSAPEGNIAIGEDVVVTASVPTGATGTVQFKNGTENLGAPVNVTSGSASRTLSGLALGGYSITAVYSGDAAYETATSGAKTFTIVKRTATVGLTASSASVDVGTAVTLTATVPNDATGTVQFKNGTEDLGTPQGVTSGTAALTLSDLPLGANSITAVYSGDGNYEPATSSAQTVTVNKKTSSTILQASATTLDEGESVTLTATVPLDGTGTVQFFDGTSPVGDAVTVAAGKAEITLLGVVAGAHEYTAVYSGDSVYLSSNSAPVTVTAHVVVPPATDPTVSAVTVSRSSQAYNQKSASKRVTVSVDITGATSGTVSFVSAKGALGSAKIVVSGGKAKASLTVKAKAAVGTYSGLRAVLAVSGTSYVSPAATAKFKVVRAAASQVKIATKSFKSGSKPKIKVTVGKLSNGRVATGKVQLRIGKNVVKTVKLTAKSKGKVTVKLPKAYTKTIKVKAKFVPTSTKTTVAKSSKAVKVKAK